LALVIRLTVLLVSGAEVCEWPTTHLNVGVPFSPGGNTDRIVRAVVPFLEKEPGLPVVMVNRKGGGGGLVGTKAHIKNDPADGSFWQLSKSDITCQTAYRNYYTFWKSIYLSRNHFFRYSV
jgi:tripartite-type tricarboxylate transporter receptor subunit TctC